MKDRIVSALKIHAGEGQLVSILVGMMLLSEAGSALGGASIDALFFARFGVKSLPYWYLVLGIATFLNLMLIAGLVGRVSRARLYQALPAALAAILILARILLAFHLHWSYPLLYIGKEVVGALQAVFLWGLAGALLEARQAKRLFPLFMAGGIAGAMVGSFGTPLLVSTFGAENMLLTWSLAMVATGLLCRRLVQQHPHQLASHHSPSHRSQKHKDGLEAFWGEIRDGYRYVRQTSLLRWISVASVLFSVCWFSLLLPFSRLSTARFPNADQLASFFGLFQGAWTLTAMVVALFLASRLFARFGVINILLIYPLIYFSAFGVLAVLAVFPAIVFFRFAQLVWGKSLAETAWQAAFNAIPDERRDQARAFINAVPGQFGIIFSGLILIIGEQALQPQQLYFIGLLAAALCAFAVWRSQRAYSRALTQALRNGQPQVFYAEEEPFGGFQRDPMTLEVLLAELDSPDPGLRCLSAEILGHLSGAKVVQALSDRLTDPHPEVRIACLGAIQEIYQKAPEPGEIPLVGVTACLQDPQAEVRCLAARTLQALAGGDLRVLAPVENLLVDAKPVVRAQAATVMVLSGQVHPALEVLADLAVHPDPEVRQYGLRALGACSRIPAVDSEGVRQILEEGLHDSQAFIRKAVLDSLTFPPEELKETLVQALGDEDPAVRLSAAGALGRSGAVVLPALWKAMADPSLEEGALQALGNLSVSLEVDQLHAYITRKTVAAVRDYRYGQASLVLRDGASSLLADMYQRRAQSHALQALRAFGMLGEQQAISQALDGLKSRDPSQRAYALESLETMKENSLVRPLLAIWETGSSAHTPELDPISVALDDPDAWLRACAAYAACEHPHPETAQKLSYLAQADPDELVRATATSVLQGDRKMETLSTLTTMERILFLRKVPLFAGLSPEDLKHVAAIGVERLFPDGAFIVHQGEPGDEMFIIVSGEVRVVINSGNEIGLRKPGEYVGEMAILSQAPRMASLIAVGDVRLLCLGQKEFSAILRQRPETSLEVIRVLGDRLREQVTRLPGESHRLG